MPVRSQNNAWVLETQHTAYALGLNPAGLLTHRYWGAKLPYIEDYPAAPAPDGWASFNNPPQRTPEEYPTFHEIKFTEPCLKTTFSDGTRTTVLAFDRAEIVGEELRLHLRDQHYPLTVTLHYRAYPDYDLIERWATLRNTGSDPIQLERVWSAQWHVPEGEPYHLTHLYGHWMGEFQIQRAPLTQGVTVLESRRIHTSHHHSPYFALDRGATETSGEVWFGALAWSGNWKIAAEATDFGSTRINIGLNDWDFGWALRPGEDFVTPTTIAGYTPDGFGAASRTLHDYVRQTILPHGNVIHPMLYNSWEAVFFDVDVESQSRVAEVAASLGVELFVMDDGWFHGRNLDNAGLGDWWPDEKKFPDGLKPLVDRVNALGMDFGIWIEPEMVNPDSDLYRAHPDWVLHFANRERVTGRGQLILNLARKDVQDYLIEKLDKVLSDNPIKFIKWDMNRTVSEPGWPDYEGEAREVWVRYVQGVYRLWQTLRERHPDVLFQSCSGGGGRVDMGILRYADQVWPSDNTRATARLGIQEGFSLAMPALIMEAQVTEMEREVSLTFRFHAAMCGVLGISADITRWSESEREEARRWIALYKQIRPIVQLGDQYRLRSAQFGGGLSGVQYMRKDKREGVLFAFRTYIPDPALPQRLRLQGLNPEARYTVEGFDGVKSGAGWMRQDIVVPLMNFDSIVRRIHQV
jgi:alpha-galactosidase